MSCFQLPPPRILPIQYVGTWMPRLRPFRRHPALPNLMLLNGRIRSQRCWLLWPSGGREHLVEHGARQPACLGVLLTRVIRGQKRVARWQAGAFSVLETGTRRRQGMAVLTVGAQIGVKGESPQGHDQLDLSEELQLFQEIGLAIGDFLALRPVARRGAVDHLCNVAVVQGKAVLTMAGARQVCEAVAVQGFKQPFAAPVTREGAPGTVGAVGCRGQPNHQEPGLRVAEAGNRPAPVGFVSKPAYFFLRHAAAMRHQPRATNAGNDFILDPRQPGREFRGGHFRFANR